ncbi:MAG: hypothetical protein U0232_15100 [Thermomicrobiales bacterium]
MSDTSSVADIAGDRVVEQCAWVVFAHLGLIGIWIPLLVITRGIWWIRCGRWPSATGGRHSGRRRWPAPITEWLTASRTMRALYGIAKASAFVFLTGLVTTEAGKAVGIFASGPLWWFGWLCVRTTARSC